ncbi:MAG: DUF262 domain-containing protein [Elusimicrobia bacterium]|nr:DUF262 domain-containing protein [Elusimicrobiota bacterium]
MYSRIATKIDAEDKTLKDILHEQKYSIDFFQREYRWQRGHIEQLINDLEGAFSANYQEGHERAEIENYNSYYLGPIVLCSKGDSQSIIDGQQRLTSLTLLLIYLNNLQNGNSVRNLVEPLIRSEKFGQRSYNLKIDERTECLDALFERGNYSINGSGDESVQNLVERYNDIEEVFPPDLKDESVLPFFIDWLKEKVVFVKITAYSDENAYTIFETMNDRGLNLTPTEMLKGYLISSAPGSVKVNLNHLWKSNMDQLHKLGKQEDLEFFRAWLRGRYANTIRPGKKGAANEDFEKIGTSFHSWVKDNTSLIGLNKANDFADFIQSKLTFYTGIYCGVWTQAESKKQQGLEHVFYASFHGIASSLSYPLMLAAINESDDPPTINVKLNLSARFIETFAVLKSANMRTLAQSSIRYTIYSLVKDVRGKNPKEMASIYKQRLRDLDVNLSGVETLILHQQNKRFIRFLLARIADYIEEEAGIPGKFEDYMNDEISKPYQVEHIWEDIYERFKNQFDQRDEFNGFRNKIGGLLLLPEGTNQSFRAEPFDRKLPHYLKENLLAKSLHQKCYERNPNFVAFIKRTQMPFKAYELFNKDQLEERTSLYHQICKRIWSLDGFDFISNQARNSNANIGK